MSSTFQNTQWTVILQAGETHSADGVAAFESLCRAYWQPLFAFTVGVVGNHEDAEDLTQSFFQHLLENNLPSDVHPAKGRFRNWLLAVLKNFLAGEHRHRTRQKRGGANPGWITLEEAHDELLDFADPSLAYEKEWARSVLANGLERLREECDQAGQNERFVVLQGSLFDLAKGEGATTEHAGRLGISLNAAKVALSRLRQRYRELLRLEVSRLVEDSAAVDEGIAHLVRVLGR